MADPTTNNENYHKLIITEYKYIELLFMRKCWRSNLRLTSLISYSNFNIYNILHVFRYCNSTKEYCKVLKVFSTSILATSADFCNSALSTSVFKCDSTINYTLVTAMQQLSTPTHYISTRQEAGAFVKVVSLERQKTIGLWQTHMCRAHGPAKECCY